MKKLLLNTVFVFISLALYAQDFNNYELLKCQGEIPKAFITPSSQKYQNDIQKIDKNLKYRDKKNSDKFYLSSNFNIDNLLRSGQVLFGDPVTQYVNEVLDKVLVHNTALRKKTSSICS